MSPEPNEPTSTDRIDQRPTLSKDDFKTLYARGPKIALVLSWFFSVIGIIPIMFLCMAAGMSAGAGGIGAVGCLFYLPTLLGAVSLIVHFKQHGFSRKLLWVIPLLIILISIFFPTTFYSFLKA